MSYMRQSFPRHYLLRRPPHNPSKDTRYAGHTPQRPKEGEMVHLLRFIAYANIATVGNANMLLAALMLTVALMLLLPLLRWRDTFLTKKLRISLCSANEGHVDIKKRAVFLIRPPTSLSRVFIYQLFTAYLSDQKHENGII